MREISKVILHCSASDYEGQTAEWIKNIHIKERGFQTIGYHYFIRFDGLIEQGRKEEEIGAHCNGHNRESIGICLAGLNKFREAQFDSLTLLLCEIHARYPKATLHPHSEFNKNKTCPVFGVMPFKIYWEYLTKRAKATYPV